LGDPWIEPVIVIVVQAKLRWLSSYAGDCLVLVGRLILHQQRCVVAAKGVGESAEKNWPQVLVNCRVVGAVDQIDKSFRRRGVSPHDSATRIKYIQYNPGEAVARRSETKVKLRSGTPSKTTFARLFQPACSLLHFVGRDGIPRPIGNRPCRSAGGTSSRVFFRRLSVAARTDRVLSRWYLVAYVELIATEPGRR
jgi:hypothetical protein